MDMRLDENRKIACVVLVVCVLLSVFAPPFISFAAVIQS